MNTTGIHIQDTDFGYTLSLINGKYKMIIMYWLWEYGIVRYNQMRRMIGNISHKTLSLTLKELEADGIILRKEFPQIPPKVEYSLSERGKTLIPVLDAMCEWGAKNRPPVEERPEKAAEASTMLVTIGHKM